MKRLLQYVLTLAACWACTFSQVQADDWLVLTDFYLIDGTGAEARRVDAMTIRQGQIVSLGDPQEIAAVAMDRVTRINLDGAWVIPGLIDTHVHVARFPDTMTQARNILETALRGGVTSVRDMGGDARTLAEIQRAQLNREWPGPTLVFAGMYGGPSLFADERIAQLAPGHETGQSPWTLAVSAGTDLSMAVASTRGAGAGAIKVYGNLDAGLAGNIITEASRQGLLAWAHSTVFPAGPMDLVEAGAHSLSHAPYLVWAAVDEVPSDYSARTAGPWDEISPSHPRLQELFAAMAERDVSLDATLYVYAAMHKVVPPEQAEWTSEALAWGARAVLAAHQAGVRVTAGTDWFEPDPGGLPHTHEELALLVEEAGLSPMQALVAATQNGAHAMGILDRRGTLVTGKSADLLVLEGNPLENIRNTQSIQLVVKDGMIVRH